LDSYTARVLSVNLDFSGLSLRLIRLLVVLTVGNFVFTGTPAFARTQVFPVPLPEELRSKDFQVEVDGQPIDVAHAAASYDYVSFDTTGPVTISITAAEEGFWDKGVDIQPWRLGIRPVRTGRTIRFKLDDPAKLSISRPGDFLNHAKMLFLFDSRPAAPPPTEGPTVHIVAPGIHKGSLNPKSGETYYLQPGAVIVGSLNLWKVENVKIYGRGVILYDGPQNPEDDDGWMQKPDWHCIGSLEARHVEIDGVTCLVRSRTWSIQMKDSTDFTFDDLRVIGGNPGNANQDGMDWLGGGDTIVRDAFFRASDDVLAMQGNWDGYDHDLLVQPGHDVSNVLVEHSVLSTSISNIVRAGWPEKTYNSNHFTLRDSDVLHGGIGACGLPFALFTYWGAKGAGGTHSNFTFENILLDDWYSLFQIEQDKSNLQDFTFRNIWALGQPPLEASLLKGKIKDVEIENIKFGQANVTSNSNLPVQVLDGADQPRYIEADKSVRAAFQFSPAVLTPGVQAEFTAEAATGSHVKYTWLFGDGTTAQGRRVKHRFTDALGTDLSGSDKNGSGSFRVLLHVEDREGKQDWAAQSVVVVGHWHEAQTATLKTPAQGTTVAAAPTNLPGLTYQIYPGTWPDFPVFHQQTPMRNGIAATVDKVDPSGFTHYAAAYEGFIEVPSDGGYSFHLMARDGARLTIDGLELADTGPPFAEVCGSPGNAVRYARSTLGLRAGKHTLRLETLQSMSMGSPRLLWEGPGFSLTDVPATAYSHPNVVSVVPKSGGQISTVGP
jgi:hypothetical protein